MIKKYINSLKQTKILKGFFVDILFGLALFIISGVVAFLLQKKSGTLQNVSLQNLKEQLLSSPEIAQALITDLRSFLVILIIGILVLTVGSLLLFSLTRSLIWNNLLKKKSSKKNYWRWNIFLVLVPFHLLPYFILYFFVKSIINVLFSSSTFLTVINAFLTIALFIIFPILLFILMYSFTQEYKVWKSFATTYELIKQKWSKIKCLYLFALGTAVVLNCILFITEKFISVSIITGILFILYLAWLRVYVVQTLNSS